MVEKEGDNRKGISCICKEVDRLLEEQQYLAGDFSPKFRYLNIKKKRKDTIPILLYCKEQCKLFKAPFLCGMKHKHTMFFRVEKVDKDSCCVNLQLLKPVDMDGCVTDRLCKIYSLQKTEQCITVDLDCFLGFQALEPELVDRPMPIIEPKW